MNRTLAPFFPLPDAIRSALGQVMSDNVLPESAHPGLVFDRYFSGWEYDSTGWQLGRKAIFRFVDAWNERGSPKSAHIENYHRRMKRAVEDLEGTAVTGTTLSRLVIGMGASHALENGLRLDSTLGIPVLPGSALKGLCRAWASLIGVAPGVVLRLFGRDPDIEEAPDATGSLVFFDAVPDKWPTLAVDVMSPHYSGWQAALQETPVDVQPPLAGPLSTDNPVPVFFVAVASKTSFVFRIRSRAFSKKERENDCRDGMELLRGALENLGIGGKTAVGYGAIRMEAKEGDGARDGAKSDRRPLQAVLWMNADKQPEIDEVFSILAEYGDVDRVQQSLVPLEGRPLLDRRSPDPAPVPWDDVFDRVESLSRWLQDLKPGARPTQIVVHGHAPLPAFAYLGFLLSAWLRGTLMLNRRPDGTWDRVSPMGVSEGPYFDPPEGLPETATMESGWVSVYISSQGGAPDWQNLAECAGASTLLASLRLTTERLLGELEAPAAAAELKAFFSRIPGRFPRATGLIVAINGPATLAMLVGRSINRNLIRKLLVPNFESGRYVPALEWPRGA